MAAVKGNQPTLYQGIQAEFSPEETDYQVNKGHGRLEKRKVSICKASGNYPDWIGLKTIIRVECERQTSRKIENIYIEMLGLIIWLKHNENVDLD